jgi:peroxiredoxin
MSRSAAVRKTPRANRFAGALALAAALAAVPVFALSVPHRGQAAPGFDLPRLHGGELSLASLRGKPVYLTFFASWCAPCNSEAPSIVQLDRKYRPKGLVTLGVDEEESAARADAFAKQHALPFVVVLDDDGTAGQNYGAVGLPVHVFIERSGKISTYRLGEMSPADIEAAIEKIVASP